MLSFEAIRSLNSYVNINEKHQHPYFRIKTIINQLILLNIESINKQTLHNTK